ncbi:MAG: hypothetical protein C4B58_03260 [Deltaproteobacteria bacterium]|nr:MAG: hypothetical protein C4B58_03260 [Deltaproteobacteria bacterium]
MFSLHWWIKQRTYAMCRIILLNCILMILAVPVHAGFLDQVLDTVRDVSTSKGDSKSTQTSSVLSDAEIVKGLREALRVGEEKKIRTDPVARTTDILKTVFSN